MPRRSAHPSIARNAAGTDSFKMVKRLGKCDCGGVVYGVEDFGQMWAWCDTCSPVTRLTDSTVSNGDRTTKGEQ